MPILPKDALVSLGKYRGKQLVIFLVSLFIAFLVVGFGVGFVIEKISNRGDSSNGAELEVVVQEESYTGIVAYLEPFLHPEDNISYVLMDPSTGEEIILLKARDQKLEVTEGSYVTVFGEVKKTVNREDYLMVERMVMKSVSN